MMQPQATTQPPQAGPQAQAPQMAPQGNPAPQQAPVIQHAQQSGRAGQPYDHKVLALIEQHLTTLPDDQKGYLVQYMTPELAIILGIVIGHEAFDYFSQFADPKKMLSVVPRPAPQQNSAPQQNPQQGQPQAQQPAQSAPPQVAPQPKATAPVAKSIMGV